jgi:hypothetical protein
MDQTTKPLQVGIRNTLSQDTLLSETVYTCLPRKIESWAVRTRALIRVTLNTMKGRR